MAGQLRYLVREICAGVEIYFTGRSDGQYLKTAFILCDDYTELASKLFLMTNVKGWSDTHDKEARRYAQAQKRLIDTLKAGAPPDPKDVDTIDKGQGKDRFKNYHDVLGEVETFFQNTAARKGLLRTLSLPPHMRPHVKVDGV